MSNRPPEDPKRTPEWVFNVLIFGIAFIVFLVLVFVYDNTALALGDTGKLLKYVGAAFIIWAILTGIASWIRGGKKGPDDGDEARSGR